MANPDSLIKSALIGVIAMGSMALGSGIPGVAHASTVDPPGTHTASAPQARAPYPEAAPDAGIVQRCYGINAAYQNDCRAPGNSCAGQDARARDPNGYVLVPAGLCRKIAGGHLQPADPGEIMDGMP